MARGDGSVEKLPSGKFRAVVSLGVDARGHRVRRTKTFAERKQALTWKREQLQLLAHGTLADPGKVTLGEWLERWLKLKRAEVSDSTLRIYEGHIHGHLAPFLGHVLLRELRKPHLSQLVAHMDDEEVGPVRRHILVTLRQALQRAVVEGLLAADPSAGMRLPRTERPEIRCWSAAEARAFLAASAGGRYHPLFALALDSGMRRGELLGLHWPEVDLATGTVTVCRSLTGGRDGFRLKTPKTKAGRRRLVVAPATRSLLAAHRSVQEASGANVEAAPVFTGAVGGWVDVDVLRDQFEATSARAGLPRIRFHDCRHTSATLLLMSGVNIKAVSVRLGHANVSITLNIYSHYLPEMDERISQAVEERLYAAGPTEGSA